MSTFLTAQTVTLNYTTQPLFSDVTFTVQRGDKIGLIGHNGCGKSSLLKILSGQFEPSSGNIAKANTCLMRYVEQHLPEDLNSHSVLSALSEFISGDEIWRAELLLDELGFSMREREMPVENCSGGQQMRLLLARAIIHQPDLLLLDEPSNHLDLPSLLWLEQFLSNWKGSFVLVSHDQTLLDRVTNTTWIIRDQTLHHFSLPCSQARQALDEKDETDRLRHASEQKEIDRIEKSAKRLATWGKVYDNEDLARKAKTMFARKERLEEQQTELTDGTPWALQLKGEPLPANRLLEAMPFSVTPPDSTFHLFDMVETRVKSGDRIAILGSNGCGKSTLLNLLYQHYRSKDGGSLPDSTSVTFHDRCRLGYYDQSLEQLDDNQTLSDALQSFADISSELAKRSLIGAGFEYARHGQQVTCLSGGERARLLFVGLTLARYHMLFLDEPTNHLDMEGKEELIQTLQEFEGATLLVSHDRSLIEQSCNRFWFIEHGVLTEYLSVEEVYARISDSAPKSAASTSATSSASNSASPTVETESEEQLLERLLELEGLLEADKQRKPKHQKPAMQQEWQQQIEEITAQL
ncbi:ABC transporter [Vibrio orientalis CIP 102891 = ATCC 33934]|uniref:ABC transporter n=1 Tax=Vibrio orientalis CIP 102891 = ATCC 33934 TaxID=675816 RepID=C9QFE9_VIBOR|nr:ABC-F family ATP-binding cassette domain-containing protein [Vibrio orientalis]EEX94916.1 ABC transporter ATP-binding protein [Vibrio orientalis CIP 102891 = ATCC 33934]EGU46071.1 ABC transporter [Vibrio orientalis CIP 102891 = ATCC 33934]